MRTIIDIPDEQVIALANLCREQKISRAEALRRALTRLLAEQKVTSREDAFGAWKNKKIDSRQFVETLRAEWE